MTMAAEEDKWDAYPDTILEFAGNPQARIDLRRSLDAKDRNALSALGLATPFAVFSAENPGGEDPEEKADGREARRKQRRNELRTAALQEALRTRGIPFVPVDGVSPDGDHREHCVAAAMSRELAVEISRELHQLALFWYDGTRFWLLPAIAMERPAPLPRST